MRVAIAYSHRASLRGESEQRLRALLAVDPHGPITQRGLGERRVDYDRRAAQAYRFILTTLGQTLVMDGKTRQAIDTLQRTVDGDSYPSIYQAIADAYRKVADTVGAVQMLARLTVDPRTSADSSGRLRSEALRYVGPVVCDSLTAASRREMRERTLQSSQPRGIRGSPHIVDAEGRSFSIHDLLGGRPGPLVFWSKDCGWAVQAPPAIVRVAARLRETDTPIILVADGPTETDAYLREHGWRCRFMPTSDMKLEMRSSTSERHGISSSTHLAASSLARPTM